MKRPTLLLAAVLTLGCHGAHTTSPATSPTFGKPTAAEIAAQRSQALLDTFPPSARLAILREIEGGTITKASKGEFESHDLYTADYLTPEGRPGHVQVLSDGRVLSREVEQDKVAAASVPPAVQQAIAAHTGYITPSSIVRATWGETDVYVATAELSGKTHQLTFDSRGQLLKEQAEIDPAQFPVLPNARLMDRFPDLKVRTVSEIRVGGMTFFEVIGRTKTQRITATLNPDGTFKSLKIG